MQNFIMKRRCESFRVTALNSDHSLEYFPTLNVTPKKFQLSILALRQRPKIFCRIDFCIFCSATLSSDRSSLPYDVLLQVCKVLNFQPAQCHSVTT